MATVTGKGSGQPNVIYGRVAFGRTVRPGEILFARMTDPAMLADMLKASAIVTDEGGQMCHAAVVCMGMGKPYVVGTRTATSTFKDGEYVVIDPKAGTVAHAEQVA